MNSYKILPHTADVRLRVTGETLKDLFEQAVLGMARILSKTKFNLKSQNLNLKIKVDANNPTVLLIDFLSEVLTASCEEKAIFTKVNFLKISETEVETEIFGTKVDSFDEDIKAVTYHEAKIIKNKKGDLETTILFDI
ncbi:archease [Patescibacteria group bacterium]|nr:archease [Patescibacteria group bacterium]